jgi:hypothetical protein
MKVEMLRSKLYRGGHLAAGVVTDMDGLTAADFIARGWAKPAAEPAPLSAAEADALIPTKVQRRKALR